MGLGHSVLGIALGQDSWHLPQPCGRVQGEGLRRRWEAGTQAYKKSRMTQDESRAKGLHQGWWEAGSQVYRSWTCEDLGRPMSPGGRLTSRMTGSWDSVYRSWLDSVRWHWARCSELLTLKDLRASVIDTTLGQDSDWTQSNSDQGVGHQRTYLQLLTILVNPSHRTKIVLCLS